MASIAAESVGSRIFPVFFPDGREFPIRDGFATDWHRPYLVGLLYVLAPLSALYLIFLPLGGAGFLGLRMGGPLFTLYLAIVNLPFGISTALAARAIMGVKQ